MAKRLGWFDTLPINGNPGWPGQTPQAGTNDDSRYETTNVGSYQHDSGNRVGFMAGVNFDGGADETVVWTEDWVSVTFESQPTSDLPWTSNPGMYRFGLDFVQGFPAGTLTLTATSNGVPVDGALKAVMWGHDPGPGLYGNISWSYEAPASVDFVGDPLVGYAPLDVQFTDLSTGDPSAWDWDFGDGGTSILQNPSHTYLSPGLYTVSLTATFDGGPLNETKVQYVEVLAPAPEPPPIIGAMKPVLPVARVVAVEVELT